jgi:hypothetical protein
VEWLRRIGRQTSSAPAPEELVPEPTERPTPGVAALLDGVSEDRSHAVLDLGPAVDSSLRVYSRFARWVRFADLVDATASHDSWIERLAELPAQPDHPYDLLFAWNVLDWLPPEYRPSLIQRLTELSSDDARLYVLLETSEQPVRHPQRFALLNVDRMRYERIGRPVPAWPPLLPAEVERLLQPFQVTRAFTSQTGMREYVAFRRPR